MYTARAQIVCPALTTLCMHARQMCVYHLDYLHVDFVHLLAQHVPKNSLTVNILALGQN